MELAMDIISNDKTDKTVRGDTMQNLKNFKSKSLNNTS